MTLNTFFQISVSVFCVVATIFMLVLFVWLAVLHMHLKKLITKIEEILEVAKTTTGEIKGFIERTIQTLEAFKNSIFTLDFIRQIIAEAIKLLKNNNSKGGGDGQAK